MVKQTDEVIGKINHNIEKVESEVQSRNDYIERRDEYIFGDRLMEELEFIDGFDRTEYNWLERVIDIHTTQLMGRGAFNVYSDYDKRDLRASEDIGDQKQKEQDKLINQRLKADAEARTRAVQGIIDDNGGYDLFTDGARIASAYGFCVIKSWFSQEEQRWRISVLESPQNFRAIWDDSNFRERTADVYMYQISQQQAQERYGSEIGQNEEFAESELGTVDRETTNTSKPEEVGDQDMVTVKEYTGKLEGYKKSPSNKNNIVQCNRGEETNLNLLVVGNKLVRILTDEDEQPRYFIVPNKKVPRRPWGRSDVSDTCISVNRTYLERMSDWITLANKTLFPRYLARGYASAAEVPKARQRTVEVFPADTEQSLEMVDQPREFGVEYPKLVESLKEEFVRAAGISRILFEDPNAASDSNQALMTTMKNTIDIVETKQKIWSQVLKELFTDALITSAKFLDNMEFVDTEEQDWSLHVQWASVLRKEDPIYQQMLLNRWNSNTMSLSTFLEEQSVLDPGEEVDRMRDEMEDPVTAAVHGRQVGALAMQKIAPDDGSGKPDTSINLRGDLTPYQEANLASQLGFQQGPFPASAGPQGTQGQAAQENADNEQFVRGDTMSEMTPIQRDQQGNPIQPNQQPNQQGGQQGGEQNQANPQVTSANNQEGTGATSQPGSGQPSVSPQGAINQQNQNEGQ